MKFTIDQSIFAFHSDLEVILLDVNSQHFGFKLTARNTKILRWNDNLQIWKRLSPSVSVCSTPVMNRLCSLAFIIVIVVVTFFLFFFFLLRSIGYRFSRSRRIFCICGSRWSGGFLLGSPCSSSFFLFLFPRFGLLSSLWETKSENLFLTCIILNEVKPSEWNRIKTLSPFSFAQAQPVLLPSF